MHISANAQTKNLRELRCAVEAFATEIGFEPKAVGDIGLAVNEAVANIIRHAYHFDQKMPIDFNAVRTSNGITIEIRDWGNGALPPHSAASRSADAIPEPGGLGLICMKTLMNEITFQQQQPGVLLRMSRHFDSK